MLRVCKWVGGRGEGVGLVVIDEWVSRVYVGGGGHHFSWEGGGVGGRQARVYTGARCLCLIHYKMFDVGGEG